MSAETAGPRRHEAGGAPERGAPGEVDTTAAVLADYPHVAGCPPCLEYARGHEHELAVRALVSATLAHHATDHRRDPLTLASQHFA